VNSYAGRLGAIRAVGVPMGTAFDERIPDALSARPGRGSRVDGRNHNGSRRSSRNLDPECETAVISA